MEKEIIVCEGCQEEILGFDLDGYCDECLCDDCGNTLETDNERAEHLCDDCSGN